MAATGPVYWRHSASLEHDTGSHPEGPGRIPAIERALADRDWLGWERREAPEVSLDVLHAVHPPAHVAAVRAMSERGGGSFDADTVASAGSYAAALRGAGGACAMVETLLSGEASTGFCGLRPPGHHAEVSQAMGFCLFNNVAVAARHALDAGGLSRVLVFDWDVHHGNGTDHIFHASAEVLFASIHQLPLYPGTGSLLESGSGAGEGHTINLPVPPGSGEEEWLSLVEHVVAPVARQYEPELVLVSAGFDAHRDDPLAQCSLETTSFAHLAAHMRALGAELGVPVGAVLEGGYDLDALAGSVVASLEALGSDAEAHSVEADPLTARAAEYHSRWWEL